MKRNALLALALFAGLVLGFPVFSLAYYTMVRTSTPGFCSSCHEIVPAYEDWKKSTHVNNTHGIVADCMDCHLPAPQDTINFFFMKTLHGAKDVAAHFFGKTYDRAENRRHAYASFKNAQCQKCHRNLLGIPDRRGALLAHRSVLYPRKGYEKKCVDCHYNLVHVKSDRIRYRVHEGPYRAPGYSPVKGKESK